MKRLLYLLFFLAAACGAKSDPGVADESVDPLALMDTVSSDVVLTFSTEAVSPGQTVTVVVENRTEREIAYHLGCQSAIEGDNGKMWVHVYQLDCSLMRVRPTRLEPGKSAEERYTLPALEEMAVADCTRYRLRLNMDGNAYFSTPFEMIEND